MASNRGKEFEEIFSELTIAQGVDCVRFHDVTLGYSGVQNPCDFVISRDKALPSILIECKATEKSSFNFKFRQLPALAELTNFTSFVVIWFIEKKKILAIDIPQVVKLLESGIKSVNPDKLSKNHISAISLCGLYNRIKPKELEVKKLWEKF